MVVTHRGLGRSECAGDLCQRLFRSKRGQGPSNCRRRTGSGKGDWIVGDSSQRCGTEELGESDPAFIRGPETFVTPGQIYVKMLPDGEPVQLTHDDLPKMAPAFSPDGSRIAYTTTDRSMGWEYLGCAGAGRRTQATSAERSRAQLGRQATSGLFGTHAGRQHERRHGHREPSRRA